MHSELITHLERIFLITSLRRISLPPLNFIMQYIFISFTNAIFRPSRTSERKHLNICTTSLIRSIFAFKKFSLTAYLYIHLVKFLNNIFIYFKVSHFNLKEIMPDTLIIKFSADTSFNYFYK